MSAHGRCWTPFTGSQVSSVQAIPSSTGIGAPPVHVPLLLHKDAMVHASSVHAVPAGAGVCVTAPLAGSQPSFVQELPSSVGIGVPAMHCALALHSSSPLHALPSG